MSTFARVKFKEEIINSRSKLNCENWLKNKIQSGCFDSLTIHKKSKINISKSLTKEKIIVVKGKKQTINIPVNYKTFLQTKYWLNVRNKVIKRDNNSCIRCGNKTMLQVHHLTYENHYHEDKHINDMITLCNNCHKKEHRLH